VSPLHSAMDCSIVTNDSIAG